MHTKFLFAGFLVLAASICSAQQTGSIIWQQQYGGSNGDLGSGIDLTADGGFLICSSSLSKDGDIGPTPGDMRWLIWAAKISATGKIVWKNNLDHGTGYEGAFGIKATKDGGAIVLGSIMSDTNILPSHGSLDIDLTKLDATGKRQWEKTHGGSGYDYPLSMDLGANDTIYMVAQAPSIDGELETKDSNQVVWVVKLRPEGDSILWQQSLGANKFYTGHCIKVTPDGGCIIAGSTDNDGWIVKFTNKGAVEWTTLLPAIRKDTANQALANKRLLAIELTKDSGYVVAGSSTDNDINGDIYIAKLDKHRNIQWERTFGSLRTDYAADVIELADGRFLVFAGATFPIDDYPGYHGKDGDVICLWLDKDGTTAGYRWFGESADDSPYGNLLAVPTGGYVFVGTLTSSFNGGQIWVVRFTDANSEVVDGPSTSVTCYPNPTSSALHIDVPYTSGTVWISDLTSRIVIKQALSPTGETDLDLSSLPAGIYVVHSTNCNGLHSVGKIVKY